MYMLCGREWSQLQASSVEESGVCFTCMCDRWCSKYWSLGSSAALHFRVASASDLVRQQLPAV
jgi:hypothetical protein